MERYIFSNIVNDLQRKMVFLGGPRQVGKTTLAQSALLQTPSGIYLNWDDPEQRKVIFKRDWKDSDELIVLDEIHKFPKWKNFLKGTYDTQKSKHKFLVTGSARLDVYRRGGDSLLGRYHYWRLHPFCLAELPEGISQAVGLDRLLKVGGFPEPFLANDEVFARRWRRERYERIIKDDLRNLENIQKISTVSLLLDLLRERVGSEIETSNIARDLGVSPNSVIKWIEALERMYLLFVVRPWTGKLARAISKPPKIYFFDNADVDEKKAGSKFENLVASSLLKKLHYFEDREGYRFDLCYIRDREGHEVDFVIVKERKPIELIEVKTSFHDLSKNLKYFGERLKVNRLTQICLDIEKPFTKNGINVVGPSHYLSQWELRLQ